MNISHLITTSTLALLLGVAAAGDSITLKRSIRLSAADDTVRLRHVATLEGAEAIKLADLVVADLPPSDKVLELSVHDVRAKLDAAGINWSLVDLTGGTIIIRPRLESGVEAPKSMAGADLGGSERSRGNTNRAATLHEEPVHTPASTFVQERTVRGLIASLVCEGVKMDPSRIALEFDSDDLEAIAMPLGAHRYEIDPMSSWWSDRVEVALRRWDGPVIAESTSIGMKLRLLTDTPRAAIDISRNSVVATADVEVVPVWTAPSHARLLADAGAITGRRAICSIDQGEPIRQSDLRGEAVIAKGDHVKVRKLVGACVITLEAEAMSAGALGEGVELARIGLKGRRDRRTFMATVTGIGEALISDAAPATNSETTATGQ